MMMGCKELCTRIPARPVKKVPSPHHPFPSRSVITPDIGSRPRPLGYLEASPEVDRVVPVGSSSVPAHQNPLVLVLVVGTTSFGPCITHVIVLDSTIPQDRVSSVEYIDRRMRTTDRHRYWG